MVIQREDVKDVRCGEGKHVNVFNLDHTEKNELPRFCICGQQEFDIELDYNTEHRYVVLSLSEESDE